MATKRIKRPRDPLQLGRLIVDIATGQVEDKLWELTDVVKIVNEWEAKRN